MTYYPANFINDGNFILVTFDDVPEAITFGNTKAEAHRKASQALDTALTFYSEAGLAFPRPSKSKKNQVLIQSSSALD
jgi:antitoxin HicB